MQPLTSPRQSLISTGWPGDRFCIIPRLLQRYSGRSQHTRVRTAWSRYPRKVDRRRTAAWRAKASGRAWPQDSKTRTVYPGRCQDDLFIATVELRQEDIQGLARQACGQTGRESAHPGVKLREREIASASECCAWRANGTR